MGGGLPEDWSGEVVITDRSSSGGGGGLPEDWSGEVVIADRSSSGGGGGYLRTGQGRW